MTGKLTAIGSAYQTVVVEVSFGKKHRKVAGRLSDDAVLKKTGRRVGLVDFAVGDWVKVKWKAVDKGLVIAMLEAG